MRKDRATDTPKTLGAIAGLRSHQAPVREKLNPAHPATEADFGHDGHGRS
ncbi:hypothetical protein ACS15_3236 [Ralstonia insidiosa]|uniref:Uncharacterized protein n=1 Tax=Ralstonia insidiosa TaxID=190721 RepID=A0AAC9BD27_9RALS|nr:hypothetical protein ACS15_3236 [Ralstonia insidiosa]